MTEHTKTVVMAVCSWWLLVVQFYSLWPEVKYILHCTVFMFTVKIIADSGCIILFISITMYIYITHKVSILWYAMNPYTGMLLLKTAIWRYFQLFFLSQQITLEMPIVTITGHMVHQNDQKSSAYNHVTSRWRHNVIQWSLLNTYIYNMLQYLPSTIYSMLLTRHCIRY